ncbi:MAG: hypothetical protein HGA44_05300, partial [Cellulomonadaceae bacterium]|nr:hypothetical protein [Cellulomonadaceae bacterium]
MIVPTYVPGEWVAVVTDGTLAVLPPQTPPALVTELWASIREGAALTDHLQVLLRAGIAGLPPFALVNLQGGRVHVIVRGAVSVEVTTATGVRLVSAPHVSTWAEELVTDAQGVVVRTATGSVPPEAWSALPVLAAVVHADLVLVDLRSEVPLRPEPATLSSGELRILPPPPPAPVGVGPAAAPAVPVARTSGSDGAERSVPAWEPVRPARP